MVAKYDRPAEVLRDWARPYMTSNPEVFAEFEDLADSVDAIAAKLSDLVGYDLDEINKAAAALSCSTVDDTLHARSWGEEHSAHVADLVELAKSFDTFAGIIDDQSYAATDVPERRKQLFQAARKARAFGETLDVVLVGPTGNDPDFEGYDKALRDPEEGPWAAWLKTFVAGIVEFRDASKHRTVTGDAELMATVEAAAVETWGAEWSEMRPDERLRTITQTFRRSQAFCDLLDDALIVGEVDSDPDLKSFYTSIDSAETWKTWRKELVDGVIQNQKATRARSAEFEALVQKLTVDGVHKDLEIQNLRAELMASQSERIDALNAEVARLKEELIEARTKASKRAYTLEQIRVLVVDKGEEV